MEDSSANNQPLQSTQKEEPVNLTTPPPAYTTPAHPFPKFIPKRIAIIIFLIILIIFTVCFLTTAYNLGKNRSNNQTSQTPTITQSPTPTPDPTADWKTYENASLGFSFKYPSDWEESSKVFEKKATVPNSNDKILSPEAINDFKKNPKNLGMPSGYWIEYDTSSNPKLCGGDISIIKEIKTLTLSNGQQGDYCVYNEKSDRQGAVFEIQFKKDTLVFTLEEYYAEDKTKISDYLKIFDQVLSTIKFTDSHSSTNESTWKKYSWSENNKTLFSINYPNEWQAYERISENKKYQTLLFPLGYNDYEVYGKTSNITLAVSMNNPELCRGDCPVIEKSSNISINGLDARKLEGYIGEIGGNIPVRYERIIIQINGQFYVFTLYGKNLEKINNSDHELFNNILSTIKFTS